ncbi:HlyD family efflux transporter periplasmic adaptor subunit [Prevotella sp. A2931]|uniref:HlyD family efflux transporter periplasmic adaptor subunit n=1 Tax=Prevotella illustrans TaxID=2800387 RepID=A0ABS3M5U0_9BACT|nr:MULTISPECIES: HlyD family efflux transporter periplasmic adaptor subunit [Prevotella]MBO1363536.1 HlyD family efflux transporter periplasmic adaptor subunit [Prevotella illustrans]PTL27058.1 HlyD family secretion protein [Prevotella sp. oral taxon 820]
MKKIFLLTSIAFVMIACRNSGKEYDATGTFEATEVIVSAKASGELKTFTVNEGENVKRNRIVGSIDSYQLRQKQDELTAAGQQLDANAAATGSRQLDLRKQLASIAQQIANARHEQKRFAELVKDGAVPHKQLDDINNQLKVLQRQLDATRDQIRSNNRSLDEQTRAIKAQRQGVEAQKRQLNDQINNTKILSPITGTVLEKYVEQGEFVVVGKPLFKVANSNQMYIRAYVTSIQLKNIKIGQKVKVMADYGDNRKKQYDGTVTWISSRSEFTPKTILTNDERADLVYAVKVQFKNDDYVKIGMYGEVKF